MEPGDFSDGQVDKRRVGDGLQDGHEAKPVPGQQVMVQYWEVIGLLLRNTELSMELWNIITVILGFDD